MNHHTMNPTLRNVIAVIIGLVVGSGFNMGIIMVSGSIIPPPAGVDPAQIDSLVNNMYLFKPKHFIMPFLAHAIGTLVGAFLAAKIAAKYHFNMAMIIGLFFLLGGISSAFMLPAPTWFILVDVVFAYIPMAVLGARLAIKSNQQPE
ncbi:hypothetical protein [Paucihalobacter sp.]|uniref:hypothetical protein n=2 Tax=Paucihalobacter sp. TaxID=2850405 RepID=UPI003D161EEB